MTMQEIRPIHPGEHLAEFLDEFGISQYRLAKDINVDPRRIHAIVNGERGITADTALRLSRYFTMSVEYWMNLQDRYEIELARAELGDRLEQEVKQRAATHG